MPKKTVSHFRIYFDGIFHSFFLFWSKIKMFIYVNPIMYTQFMMALTLLLLVSWHSLKFVCHAPYIIGAQWVGIKLEKCSSILLLICNELRIIFKSIIVIAKKDTMRERVGWFDRELQKLLHLLPINFNYHNLPAIKFDAKPLFDIYKTSLLLIDLTND